MNLYILKSLFPLLIHPDTTRVVLRPRDNDIPFIVERARENLIFMLFQSLKQLPSF